jgi:hypothetical protein
VNLRGYTPKNGPDSSTENKRNPYDSGASPPVHKVKKNAIIFKKLYENQENLRFAISTLHPAYLTGSIPSWPKGYFVICYFVIFCFSRVEMSLLIEIIGEKFGGFTNNHLLCLQETCFYYENDNKNTHFVGCAADDGYG